MLIQIAAFILSGLFAVTFYGGLAVLAWMAVTHDCRAKH